MKPLNIFIGLLLFTPSYLIAMEELVNKEHCLRPTTQEKFVYSDDFRWFMTMDEIKNKEKEIYESGKRLQNRAYLNDNKKIVLPLEVLRKGTIGVPITNTFIKSIRKHIETAFARNYIDALIFPDMGHSHFFIPKDYFDKVLNPIKSENFDVLYTKMLAYPKLKILYHTAEQLKMFDDSKELIKERHLNWRFYTRNLVGDNKGIGNVEIIHNPDHSYNTAREYEKENYRFWGAGFSISTSKNGCFPYMRNKKIHYFDISLKGLGPSNSGDVIYDDM